MRLERGFAKKSLARIITSTVLFAGGIGIGVMLDSCSANPNYNYSNPENIKNKTNYANKTYPYSTLENQVYNYVDKFSKKIPTELVRKDNFYHDLSLELDEKLSPKSGKGRMVINIYEPNSVDIIMASYLDANELKLFERRKDPNELKSNIIFAKTQNLKNSEEKKKLDFDELLILNKGKNVVLYMKTDGKWKTGSCEFLDERCYEELIKNGKPVVKEQVKRHLNLAKRFRETYFKEEKK